MSEADRILRERAGYLEDFAFASKALDEWGFTACEKAAAFGFTIAADAEWKAVEGRVTRRINPAIHRCASAIGDMKCQLFNILTPEEQKEWMSRGHVYLGGESPHVSIASGRPGVSKAYAVVQWIMGDLELSAEKNVADQQIRARAEMILDKATPYNLWRIF